MLQLQLRIQNIQKINYGKPVETFKEIFELLDTLEEEWREWSRQGFPPIDQNNPICLLEASETYVISENDQEFCLGGDSEFHILN